MRKLYSCVALLLVLPGCARYYKWGKQQFPQINKRCTGTSTTCFVRSADVYDEFQTVGRFDALWFSDEVRCAYVQGASNRFGVSERQKEIMHQQQHDENAQNIIFYVLMTADDNNSTGPLLAASDKQAQWTAVLVSDGKEYPARAIKRVDLEPELLVFFGNRYSKFRVPYKVEFDRFDSDGHDRIPSIGGVMQLSLRSATYEVILSWESVES